MDILTPASDESHFGLQPVEKRGINLDDIPDFNPIWGVSKLLKAQLLQIIASMQTLHTEASTMLSPH